MLNVLAKFLLVSTSMAPVLGAVAVNQFSRQEPVSNWGTWLAIALLLVVLCWAVLVYAASNGQKQPVVVEEFERNDREVLAFLLAYLLPFVSAENMSFTGDWLTGAYILAVIFLVVQHAGAFHFNPVMGVLGYHFYGFTNADGVSHLLISRAEIQRARTTVQTVRLSHGIYLHIGAANA